MTPRKRKALEATATRGGTPNERDLARQQLESPKPKQEIVKPKAYHWGVDGILSTPEEVPKHFRASHLKHLLSNIKEKVAFTYKTIPFTDSYGSGHFYVIITWLTHHHLVTKEGSKYMIVSKEAIRAKFNQMIESTKI